MAFSKNVFFNSDYRNENSGYQLVALPKFAKFDSQTIEIQPFKVEFFRGKCPTFKTMTSLYLKLIKILEFSLACGVGLP